MARLVICSYWFKEEEAIVSVSDSGAAGFFAPTPHVERKHSCERSRLLSLLLQYTPCNLIRALCRGTIGFGVVVPRASLPPAPSYAAKLAYMLSPITADGHAAGGGLMLARPLVLRRRDNFSSSCQALLEPPLLMSSCCFAFLE